MHGGADPDRSALARLPAIGRLLAHPACRAPLAQFGRAAVLDGLRATLEAHRAALRAGHPEPVPSEERLIAETASHLERETAPGLVPVINATGIVLHTNLGRAPLAPEAAEAAHQAATTYGTLEFDLAEGTRGDRTGAVERQLCALTGAVAALAVNNGAAAILLALSALASGGDVVVSRGELVEIGGGFRIPDVIETGGARLVETGTTNRTRLADYESAITGRTRVLLRVHASNFRMSGFTQSVPLQHLAGLARRHGLHLVADLGSGSLAGDGETSLPGALAAGADLVTASGDKLLGGPQAGLIAGTRDAVGRLRRHPLLRALRLDKMSVAALETTLRLHRHAPERIPVLRMLATSPSQLADRAARLVAQLPAKAGAGIVACDGYAGGGALPGEALPSHAVTLAIVGVSSSELARRLRGGTPPVIARIAQGHVQLDMRTVAEAELPALARRIGELAS